MEQIVDITELGCYLCKTECQICKRRIVVQLTVPIQDKSAAKRTKLSVCCAKCFPGLTEDIDQSDPYWAEEFDKWCSTL